MRNQRNILLSAVAAFALAAATGIAFAHEPSPEAQSATPGKAPQAATQPMKNEGAAPGAQARPNGKMGQSTQGQPDGKMGQSAQGERARPGRSAEGGQPGATQNGKGRERVGQSTESPRAEGMKAEGMKHAQRANRGAKTAKARVGESRRGRITQRQRSEHFAQHRTGTKPGERTTAAERQQQGLQGLQGNAGPQAGGNVRLTGEQRANIQRTVINAPDAPRVARVPFGVRVGTAIPGDFNVHFVPVPKTLVNVDPAWGGLLYFVYRDDIVIVNPADRRIVAVLPV